mmetsp:Transcript_58736/g.132927  ORF Transcript_58736/g.132927 Transcript_58736/m.132927 type:complete len:200 (-) Transcript_58736:185-784(-)
MPRAAAEPGLGAARFEAAAPPPGLEGLPLLAWQRLSPFPPMVPSSSRAAVAAAAASSAALSAARVAVAVSGSSNSDTKPPSPPPPPPPRLPPALLEETVTSATAPASPGRRGELSEATLESSTAAAADSADSAAGVAPTLAVKETPPWALGCFSSRRWRRMGLKTPDLLASLGTGTALTPSCESPPQGGEEDPPSPPEG